MDMSMTTTASAAMASATDMSDMDMSSSSDSMTMVMTFFTGARTSLFADAWTPQNDGQYAGTCIFLIVLALLWRALIAFRPIIESRFWTPAGHGTISTSRSVPATADEASIDDSSMHHKSAMIGTASLVPGARMGAAGSDIRRRYATWSVGSAASRATYDMFVVGVGYLLMLAVMTMNVGYFLSVLAGAWLGTFVLGSLANEGHSWEHC